MSTLKEQFTAKNALHPLPRWVCGDRVSGRLGKIPVIGAVIREDYDDTSLVLCHLDLPVKEKGKYRWIVQISSKRMTRLKVIK